MRIQAAFAPPDQIETKHLDRLRFLDHFCLFLTLLISLVSVFGIFAPIRNIIALDIWDIPISLMALSAVAALFYSEETPTKRQRWLGGSFGALTVVISVIYIFLPYMKNQGVLTLAFETMRSQNPHGPLEITAFAFSLTGVAILLGQNGRPAARRAADAVTFALAFAVFMLAMKLLFGLAGIPDSSKGRFISTPSLCCLVLVTLVLTLRRTEGGILSVIVGYGIGSQIARVLVPFMLVAPFIRELLRAHLIGSHLIPMGYVTAVLTSVATGIGLTLVLLLARTINRMQESVQSLMLRDELTGAYSTRGFHLLAEQAFLIARRAGQPFSVLFIDMDNLKIINDQMGHSAGSVSIVETAKLLAKNFRDTDIIGRVGGDEFVVAGQFDESESEKAIERIRAAAAQINSASNHRFAISLSIGSATAVEFSKLSLRNLIASADQAMYREKRSKKLMTKAAT